MNDCVTSKIMHLNRGHDIMRLSTACFAWEEGVPTRDWWWRATASWETSAAIRVGRQWALTRT